mmetsp:Transcript_29677/g.81711  ORF Transcript_29677/g.81711 Transcript_29677/m.81711 type:complete len:202 (+) Transcript_29677:208-813(+)
MTPGTLSSPPQCAPHDLVSLAKAMSEVMKQGHPSKAVAASRARPAWARCLPARTAGAERWRPRPAAARALRRPRAAPGCGPPSRTSAPSWHLAQACSPAPCQDPRPRSRTSPANVPALPTGRNPCLGSRPSLKTRCNCCRHYRKCSRSPRPRAPPRPCATAPRSGSGSPPCCATGCSPCLQPGMHEQPRLLASSRPFCRCT